MDEGRAAVADAFTDADGRTRLYTVAQAAEAWHVSKSALYAEIAAGRLRAKRRRGTRVGYRITAAAMEDWIWNGLEDVV